MFNYIQFNSILGMLYKAGQKWFNRGPNRCSNCSCEPVSPHKSILSCQDSSCPKLDCKNQVYSQGQQCLDSIKEISQLCLDSIKEISMHLKQLHFSLQQSRQRFITGYRLKIGLRKFENAAEDLRWFWQICATLKANFHQVKFFAQTHNF